MGLFKKKNRDKKVEKILDNPQILDLNLIKDEVELSFDWRRGTKLIIFSFLIFVFIIAELYWGLDWWANEEQNRLDYVQLEMNAVKEELKTLRVIASDALSYQERTILVDDLLDNHIYWTKFFIWLENNTFSSVSFDGFSGSIDGKYSLRGRANSFAEVSWQIQQFLNDPLVVEAKVMSVQAVSSKSEEQYYRELALQAEAINRGEEVVPVSAPELGVNFNLELSVNPEIFKK